MKNINKEIQTINIIFWTISIIIMVVGLFFSYLIAELDDAPGFVIIGTTFTLIGVAVIYGFKELIIGIKKINIQMSEIQETLKTKK